MADNDWRSSADEKSIADLVVEVSEKASLLVREEIELAKAEVEQKVKLIGRGAVVAAGAAFFVLLALILAIEAAAWAINEAWGYDHLWIGFLIAAGGLILLAIAAAFVGMRAFSSGTPPTPDRAIEEARLIKEAIEHPEIQIAASRSGGEGKG